MLFLSPILLTGLALAAVPVIIHLLNRRRFRVIEWAPMKYLKLTIKSNRRRLRIEQLILLAVRTLAIIILVLALARPILGATGLGALLGGRNRTARVLVLDDSLSMGYQVERRPALDLAKDAATRLIRGIGAQDSVTVVTTSAVDAPLVRDAHLDDPAKLLGLIGALGVSDTASDWAATFKAVDGYLATAAFPVRDVMILTDLRRSGWNEHVTDIANRWAGQAVTLRIVDVGSRQTQNFNLESFEQEDPVALPNTTIALKARVRNNSGAPLASAQALLSIAGESRPILLPDLPPGGVTEIPLSASFQKPGQYPLRLSLPGDALPGDDARWLAVDVRPNLDVLLVDGQPSSQPFESTTDFLATAFTIGSDPWHVQRSAESEWLAARPIAGDVTVLSDVASLPPEHVAALERLVRGGMGLIIFPGDQVDPELYNQRLYRDGAGLLPCRLNKASDGPLTGLTVEPTGQSPLLVLNKLTPAALSRIVAKRYLAVHPPPAMATQPADKVDPVRVLARWNDPQGSPAVIEKRFGRGTVLLWTITADKKWSDWPIDPTYVLAVRAAATALARGERQQDTLTAGQPIQLELEPNQQAASAHLTPPGAGAPQTLTVEKSETGGSLIRYRHTASAGAYTLSWKDATGIEHSHLYCANPDKAESDLEPISDARVSELLGSLHPSIIHYQGAQSGLTQQGKEIWRTLALVLLAMFAFEAVFAVWVGRER